MSPEMPHPLQPETSFFTGSKRIQQFLTSVQPGQRYAFVDMDQSIFAAGIDSEELAFMQFGLIPEQDRQSWNTEIAMLMEKGAGDYLVDGRKINLRHYPTHVTQELEAHTGIPAGTIMSQDVVRALGTTIGEHIVTNNLYRENAIKLLQACEERDIHVVILTATPVDLAEGAMETLSQAHNLTLPTVIGTEDVYNQDGTVNESLFIYGPTKTALVEKVKKRGGIAAIGIGDKFTTSDAFIHECKVKGHIDNKSEQKGEEGWAHALERTQARF